MPEHFIETLGPVLVLGVPAAVIAYQFWRARREGGLVSDLVGAPYVSTCLPTVTYEKPV